MKSSNEKEKILSEDEVKQAETFAKVGQTVDYTLPESETVGGQSTFEATVTRVYDDGETVDLEFLPPGAESEKVLRTMVPYGPGSGAWFEKETDNLTQDGDGNDDTNTGEGSGADGADAGTGGGI